MTGLMPVSVEAPAPARPPATAPWRSLGDLAVVFTLAGHVAGFLCMVFAASGRIYEALLALVAAGFVDFWDGWLARKLHPGGVRTVMSSRLDAVVDGTSFGVAPALLGWAWGLRAPWQVALLALFAAAAALRLGHNASQPHTVIDGRRHYVGLPVTYVALAVPWAFLGTLLVPRAALGPALAGLYGLLAGLMVSGLRFPKPRGLGYVAYTAAGLVPAAIFAWIVALEPGLAALGGRP